MSEPPVPHPPLGSPKSSGTTRSPGSDSTSNSSAGKALRTPGDSPFVAPLPPPPLPRAALGYRPFVRVGSDPQQTWNEAWAQFFMEQGRADERLFFIMVALMALVAPRIGPRPALEPLLRWRHPFNLSDICVLEGTDFGMTAIQQTVQRVYDDLKTRPNTSSRSIRDADLVLVADHSREDLNRSRTPSSATSRVTTEAPSRGSLSRAGPSLDPIFLTQPERPAKRRRSTAVQRPFRTVLLTGEFKPSPSDWKKLLGQGFAYALTAFEQCGCRLGLLFLQHSFSRLVVLGENLIALETVESDDWGVTISFSEYIATAGIRFAARNMRRDAESDHVNSESSNDLSGFLMATINLGLNLDPYRWYSRNELDALTRPVAISLLQQFPGSVMLTTATEGSLNAVVMNERPELEKMSNEQSHLPGDDGGGSSGGRGGRSGISGGKPSGTAGGGGGVRQGGSVEPSVTVGAMGRRRDEGNESEIGEELFQPVGQTDVQGVEDIHPDDSVSIYDSYDDDDNYRDEQDDDEDYDTEEDSDQEGEAKAKACIDACVELGLKLLLVSPDSLNRAIQHLEVGEDTVSFKT